MNSRHKVGFLVIGIVTVLTLVGLLSPTRIWDGAMSPRFRVQVLGIDGMGPMKGATVRLLNPAILVAHLSPKDIDDVLQRSGSIGITDAEGHVTLRSLCGAGGTRGLFGRSGRFEVTQELSVEAAGQRRISAPLAGFLGGRDWSIRHTDFKVRIWLIKDPP